ncbi:MAG TPA: ABC transporter ATP-binding protein [Candidatus Faecimorpha stercoravium]|nr:ABC transporter ATP-binding protein [Candidatus Faecimorpha stercoravium]
MKKLLVYMKDYKKESILGPLFKLLEASFELLVPLVVSAIIDVGIANRDVPYIVCMVLLMVALGVIGLVCSITAQYFAAKAAVGFTAKVRSALFAHIQSLSYTEMDTMGTSTLITRMTSDMNQVQNGVNLVLRLFLRSPFIVFGAMIMAFTIDVKSAMVFVVTIPALSIVVFGVMLISMPLYKKVQAGLDRILRRTRENLSGVRVIRAFNKEESEIQQFDEENRQLTKMQMFVGRISALMNPITYVIINVATLVLIWTGAWQVESGILTQGQVVALVNYMSQILVELIKLANLVITVTKAWACANRIESIFDQQSSMQYPKQSVQEDPIADVITFENVGLTYKNAGAESLSNLNFSIHRGQTVGIIGGTGAGKTSLVNLIPRFYDASQGRVLVNGVDVREYPQDQLRDKIGIVPQKAVLFGGSIADNLRWGKEDATREELMDALRISQAEEFVEKREGGIDAMVAQNGKNLSGGQRQRLTIARALVRKPEILILDDSASALDYATDAKLRKAIRQMDPSVTVLIVSQRAASIQYADQIIVLDDGEAVGIGTHQELLQNCPVYQEIYYSQFPKEVQA